MNVGDCLAQIGNLLLILQRMTKEMAEILPAICLTNTVFYLER